MSQILTNNKHYSDIADTIRQMKDVNTTYKPREMAPALKDIYSNEVEGTLPLSFESNGMPLLDYRIDGASGGVGDLITDSSDDNYGKYKVPVVCGGTTTNIYLDKPIDARANIPNEYEEVEYLESTGTQYIDTGFVPNSNSGFKTKIVFTGHTAGIDDFLIGVRSNSTYGRFAYTCTSNTFYCSFGSSTSSLYRYNTNMPSTEIIECELNYKNSNKTSTQGVEGLLPDKNNFNGEGLIFYLAGAYNAKGIPKYKTMRQYECVLTQGTEVVRDLVPCYRKSDNVAGLYDLVNNTFYTNQGTGNFMVGPIKENERISLSDTGIDIPTIDGANTLTIDTTVQPANVHVQARKNPDFIALDMSNIKLATSTFTTLPSVIANADWSQVTNTAGMFNYCSSLTTVPELDLSNVTNVANMFNNCSALTTLGGFKNLGKAYLTSQSANYSDYKLDLSTCTSLTHDSLMNVINNLYDIAAKGCNTQQLLLGSTNLAKLSAEEISTAVNKGWSVS